MALPVLVTMTPFALRDDVRDLVTVCRAALQDSGAWPAMRDCEPGTAPGSDGLLVTLADVGLLAARQLSPDEGGLTVAEAATLIEVVGEELAAVSIAGGLAAGPLLSATSPGLAEQVASGAATVAVAIVDEQVRQVRVVAAPEALVLIVRAGTVTLVPAVDLGPGAINDIDPSRPVRVTDLSALAGIGQVISEELATSTALGHEVLMAAETVGAARAACARTTDYVKDRMQFGRSIGSFQAVKHALADVWCDVEVAAAAVQAAARDVDAAPTAATTRVSTAVAVATASDALLRAAETAVHLHGGMGIAWESGMRAFLRRALATRALLDPDRRCERVVFEDLRSAR